jgi:hypothetical protein
MNALPKVSSRFVMRAASNRLVSKQMTHLRSADLARPLGKFLASRMVSDGEEFAKNFAVLTGDIWDITATVS